MNYIEVDGKPVPCDDIDVWGIYMESSKRIVKQVVVGPGVRVSTVFLGIDHGYGGTPLLYETMIFGGPHDEYQVRYTSREESLIGHERAVRIALGEEEPD